MRNFNKVILFVFIIFVAALLLIPEKKVQETIGKKHEPEYGNEVKNLEVFARIYGYVRYFHPSDEAANIDWDEFAIYGVNRIKQAKNEEELLRALNELFTPIAPTISLSSQKVVNPNNSDKAPKNAVLVIWQHQRDFQSFDYSSERIYSENSNSIMLFDQSFKYGDNTINKKIEKIHLSLPTILFSVSEQTIGSTKESKKNLKKLEDNIHQYLSDYDSSYDNEDVRIANVIISWNTFQHFYPYFKEIPIDWVGQLPKSIQAMKNVKNEEGTYDVMRNMAAQLKDGHIGYIQNINPSVALFKIPISVKHVERKLVVTFSEVKEIQPGDVLLKLDGKDALKEFKNLMKQTSGTIQWKEQQAAFNLLASQDQPEAKLIVERDGQLITVDAPYNYQPTKFIDYVYDRKKDFSEIEPGIYYINFFSDDNQLDDNMISKLSEAKGIIVDIRGYPRGDTPKVFLSHLTDRKLDTARFLKLQPIFPDHSDKNGYENGSWSIEPKQPKIKGKVVFLTDASAISYSETIMGIVEHYKLGEIVGEPTAGTNGNVVQMFLPGGMKFYWTGLKVVKHDGSQHHNVGISPTVPVKNTIKGLTEKRDEQLEMAIKLIKEN
ncbi:S41 family peptidase [Neobacillus sp. YIM B06451]|uniref:S41 family peptidase n=1 Tax=Neobacillus sp. YIM B06451 TaxID=3070994 RepID=UPI0029312D70|nr:S41 family peptidase [Neobacillus sp. YIM B06451]